MSNEDLQKRIIQQSEELAEVKVSSRSGIHISKLDIFVILCALAIMVILSFVYNDGVGAAIVVAFCTALAIRDALLAPYKSQRSETIKTMFVSCLIMGFTGFFIAITLDPQIRIIVGSLLGILLALGLYLISSFWKSSRGL
jgi:K+ transporter